MRTVFYEVQHRGVADAPTVLLSSGLGGLASYWREQSAALGARGATVIVYDQRGTGRSRDALPRDYTIARMAEDVRQILDDAEVARCHFVGHALGGLVGMQLALDAAERVASLTLVNAWPSMRAATRRCFDARLRLLQHAGVEAYVDAQPIFLYPPVWMETHGERVEAEVRHAIESFPGVDTMLARIRALSAFDISGRLGSIAAPTLLVAASDDVLVPSSASALLEAGLPQATLRTMPYGGHACNVTCPEPFNAMLTEFIVDAHARSGVVREG
ncbi:pyrimidine utilization protein D [Paraburkholderia sp. MMS20-SJTR3]|uniref:Putative carbamate hydrolase RutD n=1 Tax=Paraburkholderia sejongensis TaxID=2886946 RepID=A0ABS8JSN7_9BURK|nr:pyrimidine utilization protein D [Paraburkholderia sp. MMS20-SJTR3]MCC8392897.1 pyrimidine utilization protein D [Paraburkholderia sp. MMS20-SJTR3]